MCKISTKKRKQIEECFDWMKDTGLMRILRPRDQKLVNQPAIPVYNSYKMKQLLACHTRNLHKDGKAGNLPIF